jgi:hypothetical protein
MASTLLVAHEVTATKNEPVGASTRNSRVSQKSLIGMSEAQATFKSLWPRFLHDVEFNAAGLPAIASPHLIHVLVGVAVCGCLVLGNRWTSYELTAPRQTTYPISFLAEVDDPNAFRVINGVRVAIPFITLVVFEKANAHAGWMVSRIVGNGDRSPLLASTSAESMDTTPLSTTPFARAFSQLISAMDSARNAGNVSPSNMWSRVGPNDDPGKLFAELKNDYRSDQVQHAHQVGGYTMEMPSTVFVSKGGSIECAYVLGTVTYSGSGNVQPPNRSNFGPLLAPGTYSSVTLSSTRDACVLVTPSGFNQFIGVTGGVSGATGVLAAAAKSIAHNERILDR